MRASLPGRSRGAVRAPGRSVLGSRAVPRSHGCVQASSSRFYVHPFREGNTRTQFAFFRQLCTEAGYTLHTDRFIAVKKADLAHNPLLGDLREQFVWGRYEYMQTGGTRLMRKVLDMAITDPTDPLPVGPIIDHGVDLRAIAAATLGHRDSHQVRTGGIPAPKADDPCVDLSRPHHSSREPDV
ncbi:hypothetical protein [Rhodococcus ruber]|uniref:hypothetical protein n=1 Tax=Rhodococcus ruber TaxID=1830 RepID=UPI001F3F4955|nr:hypothetical protein [Rhodococcus ruber]